MGSIEDMYFIPPIFFFFLLNPWLRFLSPATK